MAVFAKMMIARIARRKKTIAVPETRSMGSSNVGERLLGSEDQHQLVDALNATALSFVERPMVPVARVPPGPAQFGLADAARRDILDRDGDLADQLIDGDLLGTEGLEHRVAEQREQNERERGEQKPLHPHLRMQAEQLQRAEQERRQPEEDQV